MPGKRFHIYKIAWHGSHKKNFIQYIMIKIQIVSFLQLKQSVAIEIIHTHYKDIIKCTEKFFYVIENKIIC